MALNRWGKRYRLPRINYAFINTCVVCDAHTLLMHPLNGWLAPANAKISWLLQVLTLVKCVRVYVAPLKWTVGRLLCLRVEDTSRQHAFTRTRREWAEQHAWMERSHTYAITNLCTSKIESICVYKPLRLNGKFIHLLCQSICSIMRVSIKWYASSHAFHALDVFSVRYCWRGCCVRERNVYVDSCWLWYQSKWLQ